MQDQLQPSPWQSALDAAVDAIHNDPLPPIQALRDQHASLKEVLPKGALRAQERAANELERQLRAVELRRLAEEVVELLAGRGIRLRIDGLVKRRRRKAGPTPAIPSRGGSGAGPDEEKAVDDGGAP